MSITAATQLPTSFGNLWISYHESPAGTCLSFRIGTITTAEPLLVRLHSACLFGEALGGLNCDCGAQLAATLTAIGQAESGVIIYLFHEGRGIGLRDKIRALELQRCAGLDTVAALQALGYPADPRTYGEALSALADLNAPARLCLISNNPRKRAALEAGGYTIVEQQALRYPVSHQAYDDLVSRVALLGHQVDFSLLQRP